MKDNKNNNDVFKTYKKLINEAKEDLKTKGRRHKQIPNILTLMRLTAPCFIIPAAIVGSVPLVLGLTALFGLTDLADGFIARKWNLTSELGIALDAMTDKIFASTLLLAASIGNPMLLCNLGLEAAIASINVSKKLNGGKAESSYIGKTKTWFLFALAGAGIVSSNWNMQSILNPLMISTTVMQTLTIASYLVPETTNNNINQTNKEENKVVNEESISDNQNEQELEKQLEKEETTSVKQEREDLQQLKAIREELSIFATSEQEKEKTIQKVKKQ